MILLRSTHNQDLKGLPSKRNFDFTLTSVDIATVLAHRKGSSESEQSLKSGFQRSINKAKHAVQLEKELVFSEVVNEKNLDFLMFIDLQLYRQTIVDENSVEVSNIHYDKENRKVYIHLRNTLDETVKIGNPGFDTFTIGKVKPASVDYLALENKTFSF